MIISLNTLLHLFVQAWRAEDFRGLLFFYLVGSGDWTWVRMFGGKHLYLLSLLTTPTPPIMALTYTLALKTMIFSLLMLLEKVNSGGGSRAPTEKIKMENTFTLEISITLSLGWGWEQSEGPFLWPVSEASCSTTGRCLRTHCQDVSWCVSPDKQSPCSRSPERRTAWYMGLEGLWLRTKSLLTKGYLEIKI